MRGGSLLPKTRLSREVGRNERPASASAQNTYFKTDGYGRVAQLRLSRLSVHMTDSKKAGCRTAPLFAVFTLNYSILMLSYFRDMLLYDLHSRSICRPLSGIQYNFSFKV